MRYFLKYSIKILKFKVKEIFDFVKINRKMSSFFFWGVVGERRKDMRTEMGTEEDMDADRI